MKTTALRIEILIIGFQTLLWFSLSCFTPGELLVYAQKMKDVSILATFMLFVVCYSLGAVVDGATGLIEDVKSLVSEKSDKVSRSTILWLKYPEAARELNQSYYDLRLLRSTVFNLLMATLASFYNGLSLYLSCGTGLAFLLVGISWWRRRNRVSSRKKQMCIQAYTFEDQATEGENTSATPNQRGTYR
jgi:hypothetical protein